MALRVQLCSPIAKVPTKADSGAAGFDLYASKPDHIESKSRKLIETDIRIAIPKGYYGRIAPRSGLSVNGIDVGAGVCDSTYRGLVKVLLINNSDAIFEIEAGNRIAQLILEKYGDEIVTEEVSSLDQTERGEGGFGSSGK